MSNQKMMQQIVIPLVALIIGIGLGAVMSSEGLFGTAADSGGSDGNLEVKPERFYMVRFEDAQNYLREISASEDDNSSIDQLNDLSNEVDLAQFVNSQDAINTVLFSLQASLLSGSGANDDNAAAITSCVGVEASDNYDYSASGPGIYVYVEVPEGVDLPDDLQGTELDSEKESSVTWAATCLQGDDDEK